MKKNELVLGRVHTQPTVPLPEKAYDCHVHIFGPYERYPLTENRSYTPAQATVHDLEKHQYILGLERVVLVQPSIYGTDNSCLLNALRVLGPDIARGIAVVDKTTTPETLYEYKAAGVKGIRLNLSAAGSDITQSREELRFAKKITNEMEWHLQLFAPYSTLIALRDELEALKCQTILDHFAGVTFKPGSGLKTLPELTDLYANANIIIKLAAPYIVSTDPDHNFFRDLIGSLASINPDRLIWGSNWPHPSGGIGLAEKNAHSPFRDINDGHIIDTFYDWIGDRDLTRKIFSLNPDKLFNH
ncbi:amidohydrolase family protein [Pantoea cypripedii]|nr:amidohydrolase family protein [Pantoea cypripedii]